MQVSRHSRLKSERHVEAAEFLCSGGLFFWPIIGLAWAAL
jgi:hypothetical protein